jgi:hypothetical protein
MLAHRRRRPLLIADEKRVDDRLVLVEALPDPAGAEGDQPPVGDEALVDAVDLLGQHGVAASGVDREVEDAVGAVEPIGVDPGRSAGRVRSQEVLRLARRHPPRGEAGGEGLELGHDLERLEDLPHREGGHHGALVREEPNDADGGELLQGLADRGARHPEPCGQRRLVEPVARRELAFEDHPLQPLREVHGARAPLGVGPTA